MGPANGGRSDGAPLADIFADKMNGFCYNRRFVGPRRLRETRRGRVATRQGAAGSAANFRR